MSIRTELRAAIQEFAAKMEEVLKIDPEVRKTPKNEAAFAQALTNIRRARDDQGTLVERLTQARVAVYYLGRITSTPEVPSGRTAEVGSRIRRKLT